MDKMENIYIPEEAEIKEILPLTSDVKLFRVAPGSFIKYQAGQFFMVSLFGFGEVPISATSTPQEPLMFCIKKVGHVTTAVHNLKEGDSLGIRGPYGRGFSIEQAKGRDVIVMAGGMGIAPLRPLVIEVLRERASYGKVFLLYGSKTPSEMIYKEEMDIWSAAGIEVLKSVDCSDKDWKGPVGLVTGLLSNIKTNYADASAFICGPEVMIKAAMKELSSRGMPDDRIITTLESHMKCGVGKCGHCFRGPRYVCTDGPVFSLKELREDIQ